ncbi:MAG: hypothetical protein QOH53_315 [Ilumatobacteraceae bacterium]|jgi:hypothetical protein
MTVRVYGTLVGLYPRGFGDDYGADTVQLVRDPASRRRVEPARVGYCVLLAAKASRALLIDPS